MRAAAPLLALAGLASIAIVTWRKPARAAQPSAPTPRPRQLAFDELQTLIAQEAQAVGLYPPIALAFADAESRFNPNAEGDLQWPYKEGGARYRKYVLENPRLARNPWRNDPSVWHAYGLFQLLAPFHVLENEHPSVLLSPVINAHRGVRTLLELFKQSNGQLHEMRRRYLGCGPGTPCANTPQEQQRIETAWNTVLKRWGL